MLSASSSSDVCSLQYSGCGLGWPQNLVLYILILFTGDTRITWHFMYSINVFKLADIFCMFSPGMSSPASHHSTPVAARHSKGGHPYTRGIHSREPLHRCVPDSISLPTAVCEDAWLVVQAGLPFLGHLYRKERKGVLTFKTITKEAFGVNSWKWIWTIYRRFHSCFATQSRTAM